MNKNDKGNKTNTESIEKNPIKIVYSEPSDYFPENLRKKHKIGEFAENNTASNKKQ